MAAERVATGAYGAAAAVLPPRDNPARDDMPAPARPPAGSSASAVDRHHHHHARHPPPPPPEVEGPLLRLEQQVAYNYSCLQSHQHTLDRMDHVLAQFQADVMRAVDDLRLEMRSRPTAPAHTPAPGRYDPGDIDLLTSQIASVTTKANEVDNIKVQMELLKRRLKRIEDETVSQATQLPRPPTASSHRDNAAYDTPAPPAHHQQQPPSRPHQHLPPIQTGGPGSPEQSRQPPSYHSNPPVDPAASHHHQHVEHRPPSNDHYSQQPSHTPGFRPADPLPPPSSLSGWRPSGPTTQTPHPTSTGSMRATPLDPESQPTGWAAVNHGQHSKRPYDERSSREHSTPGSPKRAKLAPLKPRNSLGDDGHSSVYAPHHQPSDTPPYPPGIRLASSESHPPLPQHAHAHAHAQAALASAATASNSFRFITSTATADAPENWPGELEPSPASARGGRGKGKGRSGRGRGSRAGAASAHQPIQSGQEHSTPEWEQQQQQQQPPRPDWHQQPHPNGYYNPVRPAPTHAEGALDYPSTPIAAAAGDAGPQDQYPIHAQLDGSAGLGSAGGGPTSSAGKKTRTKPIRNADGVLIRKDGRPDMRSVSSANNLRKVHHVNAKKDSDAAGGEPASPTDSDAAPTDSIPRSLDPANTGSQSDREFEEEMKREEREEMDEMEEMEERQERKEREREIQHEPSVPLNENQSRNASSAAKIRDRGREAGDGQRALEPVRYVSAADSFPPPTKERGDERGEDAAAAPRTQPAVKTVGVDHVERHAHRARVDESAGVGWDVKVVANAKADGDATLDRNTTLDRNATIDRNAKLDGDVKVNGDATVDRNAKVDGDAKANGNARVDGIVTAGGHPDEDHREPRRQSNEVESRLQEYRRAWEELRRDERDRDEDHLDHGHPDGDHNDSASDSRAPPVANARVKSKQTKAPRRSGADARKRSLLEHAANDPRNAHLDGDELHEEMEYRNGKSLADDVRGPRRPAFQ